MNIWIMRHGEAGFDALVDSERNLTAYGKEMAKKQGEWLANRLLSKNDKLDKIIVSPFVRAQQTFSCLKEGMQAVKFSEHFASDEIIEIWEGVTPSGDPETICSYLAFLREEEAKNVLLVSHLPLVYDLVLALTQNQDSAHFYPAVIAEIDWKTDLGRLTHVEKP